MGDLRPWLMSTVVHLFLLCAEQQANIDGGLFGHNDDLLGVHSAEIVFVDSEYAEVRLRRFLGR